MFTNTNNQQSSHKIKKIDNGKFFLPGTPLYKKILALIILAPFAAGLAFPFIDFLPSADVDRWSTFVSAGLSVLVTILFYYSHKHVKRDYSYVYPKRKITLLLYMVGMPFMLFVMFYISFTYSFARICHSFLAHDAEIVVSLSEKGDGRISGRYFRFQEYDYLWFKQLYHIRKKLWMTTAIGTKLLLTGTQSRFGIVVHSIEKYKLINSGDNTHRLANRVQRLIYKWILIICAILGIIAVQLIAKGKKGKGGQTLNT